MKVSPKIHKRIAWAERLIFILGIIVLLHILFILMLGMFSGHHEEMADKHEKKRPQRIWYITGDNGDLTSDAEDFLRMTHEMTNTSKAGCILPIAKRDVKPESLRLEWGTTTGWLDDLLPHWTMDVPSGYNLRRYSMVSERAYQLAHIRPVLGYGLGERAVGTERIHVTPLVFEASGTQLVLITCYVDSEWRAVEDNGLGRAAQPLVQELCKGLDEMDMTRDYSVSAELFIVSGRAPRVHLRKSSGDHRLDDLTMNWLLEQHAWKGHHGTGDEVDGTQQEKTLAYYVEFLVPQS